MESGNFSEEEIVQCLEKIKQAIDLMKRDMISGRTSRDVWVGAYGGRVVGFNANFAINIMISRKDAILNDFKDNYAAWLRSKGLDLTYLY